MDDVQLVQGLHRMHNLIQRIFAKVLRIVSIEFHANIGQASTIHELEENPDSPAKVVGIQALDHGTAIIFTVKVLHDADLIYYVFFIALRRRFLQL